MSMQLPAFGKILERLGWRSAEAIVPQKAVKEQTHSPQPTHDGYVGRESATRAVIEIPELPLQASLAARPPVAVAEIPQNESPRLPSRQTLLAYYDMPPQNLVFSRRIFAVMTSKTTPVAAVMSGLFEQHERLITPDTLYGRDNPDNPEEGGLASISIKQFFDTLKLLGFNIRFDGHRQMKIKRELIDPNSILRPGATRVHEVVTEESEFLLAGMPRECKIFVDAQAVLNALNAGQTEYRFRRYASNATLNDLEPYTFKQAVSLLIKQGHAFVRVDGNWYFIESRQSK